MCDLIATSLAVLEAEMGGNQSTWYIIAIEPEKEKKYIEIKEIFT